MEVDKFIQDEKTTASGSCAKQKKQRRRRGKRPLRGKAKQSAVNNPSGTNKCSKAFPKKKGKRRNAKRRGPLLRPVGAQVPRAPNNSTQFIMDDHENSSLFMDFHDRINKTEKESISTKSEKEADGSSPFQPSDWFPYNVADFKCAYQIAKEDNLMNASRGDMKKGILGLEEKAAMLSNLLAASPSRLLSCLQTQLLLLQKENTKLKMQAGKSPSSERCECISSSSSTSSTSSSSSSSTSSSTSSSSSDSDSDSSSSACTDSECDTCVQEQLHKLDEEKENTNPLNGESEHVIEDT